MSTHVYTMLKRSGVMGLLLWCLPLFSLAADYSVTPRVIDIEAGARDIIERTITITNDAPYLLNIFPTVNEIVLSEGGDITEFKGPTQVEREVAITSWLEIARTLKPIAPGETREVPLTIRMNPNVEPGEYHALLGFGMGKNRDIAEKKVRENKAPTIVVTIRVADTSVAFVDLEGFLVDKFVTENDNRAITYTLENPGDLAVVPKGEIVIYDSRNKEQLAINANPEGKQLAPGESITITTDVPISGMIGRHKAFLDVKYGANQAAAVYDTAFFYVIPWKLLLALFLLIALVVTILTLMVHRRLAVPHGHDEDGVHELDFKFKDGRSDDKDHDITLTK